MKKLLRHIIENDGKAPDNVDIYSLSLELLDLMGSPDPELRDSLGLTVLYHWIVEGTLTDGQVKHLTAKAIDQSHLFLRLGEKDDCVLMRSFSILVISAVLKRHLKKAFLTREEIDFIHGKVCSYYRDEQDVRGYSHEKGWMHSAAHGADALMYLCRMDEMEENQIIDILEVIYDKATIDYYGYLHEEYERMNNAVFEVVKLDRVSEAFIIEWIKSFEEIVIPTIYPEKIILRNNLNQFLRSLYFRIYHDDKYSRITNQLSETIDKRNPYI